MDFEQKHLDIEIIKKLPFEKIKKVLLLGNKGDAIFYNKLYELVQHIVRHHTSKIILHTNASAHDTDWWRELAKLFGTQGYVVYALDGLENTHKLHRVGTDWNKIVSNIVSFNNAGGYSICQFIKFANNKHQIDDVRKLVKSIGTKHMWIRKSRAYNDFLLRPEGMKTRHELGEEHKDEKIKCVFLEGPSFVLTVDGEIRPCCFMADDDYNKNLKLHFHQDMKYPQHILEYKKNPESINLKYNSFEDIMKSEYYKAIRRNYKHLFRCNEKCKVTFKDIVDEEFYG
jgi:hypothetical protein